MHVFWERGYDGTSVQNLVDAMGINRFSIYQTFTDKRRLYEMALERYFSVVLSQLNGVVCHPNADVDTIGTYFQTLAASLSSPLGRRGCFGQNAGVELTATDPEITRSLRDMYAELTEGLRNALARSIAAGQVRSDVDSLDSARYLLTVAQGMIVMTKTARDPHYLGSTYRHVLVFLDSIRTVRNAPSGA